MARPPPVRASACGVPTGRQPGVASIAIPPAAVFGLEPGAITVEELARRLAMAAEGVKKKPGLMRSAVGCMGLVSKYMERIATARANGK